MKTVLVSGLVSLVVSVAVPWILHEWNPVAASTEIVDIKYHPLTTVSEELASKISNSAALAPRFTYGAYLNQRGYECVSYMMNTAPLDQDCASLIRRLAQKAIITQRSAIQQTQSGNFPNKDQLIKEAQNVIDISTQLCNELGHEGIEQNERGDLAVDVVLLNKGDGDDVLYPNADAVISGVKLKLTSGQYLSIKSHSFQQVKYSLIPQVTSPEDSRKLKELLTKVPNLRIDVTAYVGANRPLGRPIHGNGSIDSSDFSSESTN